MKNDSLATYSYKAINECIQAVKSIPKTTRYKASHFYVAGKIKDVYDLCFNKTGCLLFDYDYTPAKTYFNAAYNCKCYTGKELDSMKRDAIRWLENELTGILDMMQKGEVNAIA